MRMHETFLKAHEYEKTLIKTAKAITQEVTQQVNSISSSTLKWIELAQMLMI